METKPINMVKLGFNKPRQPVVKNLIKRLETYITSHNPEHIKSSQGIDRDDSFF